LTLLEKSTNLPAGELSIEKSRKTLEGIVIEFAEQGWSLAFKGVVPLVSAGGRRTWA
jgi:hypothetical protein